MDLKAKLVELQLQADLADNVSENTTQHREFTADFMMANGVTVQEWISVKDRLPQEDEPLGVICKQVQVLLSDGFVTTGWCNRAHRVWFYLPYEQTKFIGHDYKKTPVIAWQPLAQPPKGE